MGSQDIDTWLPRVRLMSVETHDFFHPLASANVAVRNCVLCFGVLDRSSM